MFCDVLTEQTYWAKDLIFLVTEMELMGIQAWLSAYHHTPTPCKYMYFAPMITFHFATIHHVGSFVIHSSIH